MQISTSKRTLKVEHVTQDDRMALDLLDYSMVAVVKSQTFNSDGIHFETTFSRHRPDFFTFHNTAVRGY
jgi:GntR family trehalose operon transcriptional repressor